MLKQTEKLTKEIKKDRRRRKLTGGALGCLALFLLILYLLSSFYVLNGSFTVTIDKNDVIRHGLTLAETEDMIYVTPVLNAGIEKSITNISGEDLPADVEQTDGVHNGENYVAYTFYLKNAGAETVDYRYALKLSNVTNELDSAIRIRLYRDGDFVTYAKAKTDGSPEPETVAFRSEKIVVEEQADGFAPGDIVKITVVIWIEGNDPDCLDWLIGGRLKVNMEFSVVH